MTAARTRIVQNTFEPPGPGASTRAPVDPVKIDLSVRAAFKNGGTVEKLGRRYADVDSTGFWSRELEVNADLDPPGTYYTIQEARGVIWTVIIEDGDGPVQLRDCLQVSPTNPNPLVAGVSVDQLNTALAAAEAYTDAHVAAVTPDAIGAVPTSRTVAGHALTGNVSLVKGDVGLGNVDNTADLAKPISTATQTALNAKASTAALNTTNANVTQNTSDIAANAAAIALKADLVGGVIPTSQMPALAINEVFPVASQAAMLALTAERGDMARRTDFTPNRVYLLTADAPTVLGNWLLIETDSGAAVDSINGQTGTVVLGPTDVGAAPVGALAAYLPLATATAKGDLLAATGAGAFGRLPVGADGKILGTDSTQTTGTRWYTSQELVARALGWYIVTDYGADPTYGTNSTAAIDAAIAAMPSVSNTFTNSSGVLYFPAGRYKTNGGHVLPVDKRIHVRGAGRYNSFLYKLAGSTAQDLITFNGSYTGIAAMSVAGDVSAASGDAVVLNSQACYVDDCFINGAGGNCITVGKASSAINFELRHLVIRLANKYGVEVVSGSDSTDGAWVNVNIANSGSSGAKIACGSQLMSNVHIWGCGLIDAGNDRDGFWLLSGQNTLTGCESEKNLGNGVRLGSGVTGNQIIGGDYWGNVVGGLYGYQTTRTSLIGVRFRQNGVGNPGSSSTSYAGIVNESGTEWSVVGCVSWDTAGTFDAGTYTTTPPNPYPGRASGFTQTYAYAETNTGGGAPDNNLVSGNSWRRSVHKSGAVLTIGLNSVWTGNNLGNETVPTATSATSMNLPVKFDLIPVSGTTQITTITASYTGRRVTLQFTASAPGGLASGGNIVLTGGSFTPAQNETITLVSDGTNWNEVSRASASVSPIVRTPWTALTTFAAYQVVALPTGGSAYSTTARTSRSSFDATERATWTFVAGGHYEKVTATGSWVCPTGITQARPRIMGHGGAGAGGGSAALTGGVATQVGGAPGGAGLVATYELTGLVSGTSYTATIPTPPSGGTGGAASTGATGNAGTAGGASSATTLVVNGVTYAAAAGGIGNASLANSTATAAAGLYGRSSTTSTIGLPGAGGPATSTGGNAGVPVDSQIGGTAGAPATSTLGGAGGSARTTPGQQLTTNTGVTATSTGSDGVTATEPGCGGGGGGAGAPGGAGGAGGAGAKGQIELWF